MSSTVDSQINDTDCCSSCQPASKEISDTSGWKSSVLKYWQPVISFTLLIIGLSFEFLTEVVWFSGSVKLAWYIVAYLPVGFPVVNQAFISLKKGDLFTEFFLMSIATFGAFLIGEYPEGVAVMLFYSIGEAFQHNAVHKAKENIKALLDVRPETAHIKSGGSFETVHPSTIGIGNIIQVKPGERIPLDGKLLTEYTSMDTSAISGESKPRRFQSGETILAGMINLNQVIEIKVTRTFENSSISRILELVQDATKRKAKTEKFIRSFARVYTPAVVLLAVLIVVLPVFFVSGYIFEEWLYRGLIFLVISCPCALVISIPLGYFGGIGAASRNGILVKGSNYLDALRKVNTVVFDKTGTLTQGTFSVQKSHFIPELKNRSIPFLLAAEKLSNHPVAKAIVDFFENQETSISYPVENQDEIPGLGIRSKIDGEILTAGNFELMKRDKISVPVNGINKNDAELGSTVHISLSGQYAGYLIISDRIKDDTIEAVQKLRQMGVQNLYMLTGDRLEVAQEISKEAGLDGVYAELLPEQKAEYFKKIKRKHPGVTIFAGDGINDAPVLALSDVGVAMGAMGSDVAIETADVVIQSDQPSKIATAIQIGRATRNIVWQNIGFAFGVKVLVLAFGAFGLATLWEAVFADVGVALLAILNAVRIQRMDFS